MSAPSNSKSTVDAGPFYEKAPRFKVHSVEKSDAPGGAGGQNWYRYVLKSSNSTITGHRSGSREFVRAYATQCAEQLNTRATTSQSIWAPRGRKPAGMKTDV